jgi:CheY-like chemotaxis protein
MSTRPGPRILLVEDHAALRTQIVAVLAGAGWRVEEASDGRLALQMALQEPPDVLLLDLGLPAAKQHLRFPGGHLLPAGYVEQLRPWLETGTASRAGPQRLE